MLLKFAFKAKKVTICFLRSYSTLHQKQEQFDVLILGSGAAGLGLALQLDASLRVCVISKNSLEESSTYYAQGGISAVLNQEDSMESHVQDTIQAGSGLCHEDTVRYTVSEGPAAIEWLIEQGVKFTRENGYELHLTREGGHSHRRVVHSADTTGQAVADTLVNAARQAVNITLMPRNIAIDLITASKIGRKYNRCLGAYVLDICNHSINTLTAKAIVLATGGANKVYAYTSNPDGSTGDGIAMAWRAGCRVANMEFIQFHPTCLYHPDAKSFLITEALRGEGALLKLPDGTRFMNKFDERAELAPRDVVARAIDHEMKRIGAKCLYLDISHKSADFIETYFPNVYARCRYFGFDLAKEPIPIVPAAHYTCGGIMTDLHGETDLHGLYAIGEVACTGLHGANRMASNSLLECLVFARAASRHINENIHDVEFITELSAWDESRVTDSDEEVVVSHNWSELRHFMWDYVGIVRTDKRLERAHRRAELLLLEIDEYYSNFRITSDLLELRNLSTCASMIIRCAQHRKESRGLHYTLDYPEPHKDKEPVDTVLVPPNFALAGMCLPRSGC